MRAPHPLIEHLRQDLGYAARQLRQAPGFAATTILTIALGIGACTALFSVVNGVLLRPLRFTDPERVVNVTETRGPDRRTIPPAPGVYLDWVEQCSAFAQIAAHSGRGYTTRLDGRAVNVSGQGITAAFLPALGIEPMLGRNFLPAECTPGKERVAILSFGAWQGRFGGRADILNQTVLLNDNPYTIVGVLPDRNIVWNSAIYTPLVFPPQVRNDYGSHGGFGVVARIKPDVSLAQAQADLDLVCQRISHAHPDLNAASGALVEPLLDSLTSSVRVQLLVLLGAVGFVLLIACVNVASLLLARATSRQREIAVRGALGASRGRIVRQFLAESLLVCAIGGGVGTLLAYSAMGAIARFVRMYVPRTEEIGVDGTVLALALGLVLLTGLIVGLMPAWQFSRPDVAEALKDGGRGGSGGRQRQRLRSALVAIEIALAVMLLAGTGLLARSLSALQRADQGFDARNVYTMPAGVGGKKYNREATVAFQNQLLERVAALPEVSSVALSGGLPSMGAMGLLFHVVGAPPVPVKDEPNTTDYVVTPGYLKTMGIPLLRGRDFNAQDRPNSPRVVIINQELARRFFPGENPIGRQLMIMTMADTPDANREIIGVAGDVRPYGPQSEINPQVYEPLTQMSGGGVTLVVKARGPAPGLPAAVSEVLHTLDPDIPARSLRPYEEAIAGSWARHRFSMTLFTLFSAIALLLSGIGIYGVMSYAVSQRTHEIGIRMALGARAKDVLGLIFDSGARIVLLGLVLGLAGSIAFARVLRTLLFETSATDPLTLASVAVVLTAVALVACWVPARRATKVDPMVALRTE